MEPEILIMGTDSYYHKIKTDKDFIQSKIPEISAKANEDKELECLLDKSGGIPAKLLTHFGPAVTIKHSAPSGQTLVDCLDSLFIKVREYAKQYNVPYAVVHNLDYGEAHRCLESSVLTQLMTK